MTTRAAFHWPCRRAHRSRVFELRRVTPGASLPVARPAVAIDVRETVAASSLWLSPCGSTPGRLCRSLRDHPCRPLTRVPLAHGHFHQGGTCGRPRFIRVRVAWFPRRETRVLFAVPWLGQTGLVTTDTPRKDLRREPDALDEELESSTTPARPDPHPRFAVKTSKHLVGLRPLLVHCIGRVAQVLSREYTIVSTHCLYHVTGAMDTYAPGRRRRNASCQPLLPRSGGQSAAHVLRGAAVVSPSTPLHCRPSCTFTVRRAGTGLPRRIHLLGPGLTEPWCARCPLRTRADASSAGPAIARFVPRADAAQLPRPAEILCMIWARPGLAVFSRPLHPYLLDNAVSFFLFYR